MVERTRELERALGSRDKFITGNEAETVVIQRRCLRAARDISAEELLGRDMIAVLRPATTGAILPYEMDRVLGKRALTDIPGGKALRWTMLSG